MHKKYLGDGVYAEVENGMVKLTTSEGLEPTNIIYLEDAVYVALLSYVAELPRMQRMPGGDGNNVNA